jgi:Holliday junction DNA helicase RuvB
VATEAGWAHLGKTPPVDGRSGVFQGDLFARDV